VNKSHIKRDRLSLLSSQSHHRLEFGHDFDWDKVKVLDEELNFNKRLIPRRKVLLVLLRPEDFTSPPFTNG